MGRSFVGERLLGIASGSRAQALSKLEQLLSRDRQLVGELEHDFILLGYMFFQPSQAFFHTCQAGIFHSRILSPIPPQSQSGNAPQADCLFSAGASGGIEASAASAWRILCERSIAEKGLGITMSTPAS